MWNEFNPPTDDLYESEDSNDTYFSRKRKRVTFSDSCTKPKIDKGNLRPAFALFSLANKPKSTPSSSKVVLENVRLGDSQMSPDFIPPLPLETTTSSSSSLSSSPTSPVSQIKMKMRKVRFFVDIGSYISVPKISISLSKRRGNLNNFYGKPESLESVMIDNNHQDQFKKSDFISSPVVNHIESYHENMMKKIWACDYCNEASFCSIEASCKHEETCKKNIEPNSSKGEMVVRNDNKSHVHTHTNNDIERVTSMMMNNGHSLTTRNAKEDIRKSDSVSRTQQTAVFFGSVALSIKSDPEWLYELNCFLRSRCI